VSLRKYLIISGAHFFRLHVLPGAWPKYACIKALETGTIMSALQCSVSFILFSINSLFFVVVHVFLV